MASSRQAKNWSTSYRCGPVRARTPGPLGTNDHADPNCPAYVGDTPGPTGLHPSTTRRNFSVMLLDRTQVARFLRSVAYVQTTAEMARTREGSVGLRFTSTDVDTGNEQAKEKLVNTAMTALMTDFAAAASHGSKAAVKFLQGQEGRRAAAAARIQQLFSTASQSNDETQKSLHRYIASLKTTEYSAGIVISVASLFVLATAARAAFIIGIAYGSVTAVIDQVAEAHSFQADIVALVPKSLKWALKEKSKDFLAGHELEAIEKLEEKVRHLHDKIAVKQAMISETASRHNAARLTRSIAKNEKEVGSSLKTIGRYRGVTFLFVARDVWEQGKKIKEAWQSD